MVAKKPEGRKYSILGIVFAVLSLVTLPILFGPIAVIFGTAGVLKNDTRLGVIAIVLGVIFAVISTLIGMYFLSI